MQERERERKKARKKERQKEIDKERKIASKQGSKKERKTQREIERERERSKAKQPAEQQTMPFDIVRHCLQFLRFGRTWMIMGSPLDQHRARQPIAAMTLNLVLPRIGVSLMGRSPHRRRDGVSITGCCIKQLS